MASLMGAFGSNGTRAVLAALALASVGGCRGCKAEPALRLTYQVDVEHAYSGTSDATKVMDTARGVLARRLDELGARATVATRGQELVVELAALPPDDLGIVKGVLGASGRLELKMADDAGSAAVFGGLTESALPPDEGIAVVAERVPAGLDADGHKKDASGSYARMACMPPKHAAETMGECLARFRAWAATLPVPADHEVGFEEVSEAVPGAAPPRVASVGWRTLYLASRAELTGASVADARVGREADLGSYYVGLTFGPAGARRFEELTAANVNRRLAIVLDGVVESAPVIMSKIGGGKATITMGAGEPEQQLHDARQLELVLRSGALPAPLRLESEETLPKAR